MAGEVRYTTTSDGIRIAYTVSGEGPPLLLAPFVFTSFSLMHETAWYDRFLLRISQGRTLIRYDERGTGLSQREVEDVSAPSASKDAEAVLDALGIGRATVLAGGPIGPTAVWLAASRPEKVAALVLVGTVVRLIDSEATSDVLKALGNLATDNWQSVARTIAGFNLRRPPDEAARMASIYSRSITGNVAGQRFRQNIDIDMSGCLCHIAAPTLVIHSEGDALYSFAGAQAMASQIPNARLLPLQGNVGMTTLGDKMEMVTDAINSFLDETAETRRLAGDPKASSRQAKVETSSMAVIMFADIADSTALTERIGDTAFRDKARDLDAALRTLITDNGGTPIEGKLLGDGVLAVFTSARQAIEAALACGKAGDEAGLPLHLGLHAGDVIREENNVYGGAVNLAARIASLSAPGELLVSDTVRSMARTSAGVQFTERGEQALKGIEEPVRVYEVSWRRAE